MSRDLYLEFVKAAKTQDRTVPDWLRLVGRDAASAQSGHKPMTLDARLYELIAPHIGVVPDKELISLLLAATADVLISAKRHGRDVPIRLDEIGPEFERILSHYAIFSRGLGSPADDATASTP